MAYKNLSKFLDKLESKNQLKRITAQVDAELEITQITDVVSKNNGPGLLFENVKGSDFPVAINVMGSYDRMALALGVNNLDDIASRIEGLMNMKRYSSWMGKISSIPELLPLIFIFPTKVKKAPCQDIVTEPDLDKLPILKCWPQDGGKFITLPLVFTVDPETGIQNTGMYRLQKYDKNTTGMHWHLHKDGKAIYDKYKKLGIKKMPVSVALGGDPAITYAATAPMPSMIDEMLFAGFLRNKPVDLVKCITNDIYVPAHSEFILEGYVDLDEMKVEGPFGDHTGYYSLADEYPVFHIEKMTHKRNAIYPATVVGKPPMEDCYMAKATERIFLPIIRMILPEIVDMCLPLEGVFHNCAIISIKKSYPKHAFKVMNALWGLSQMMYTKMLIIVDGDIDVQNMSTVMWKVFNNIDAKRDLLISEGPLDALDHSSETAFYGYRLGIDATKKTKLDGHTRAWPDDITMSQDIIDMVKEKWSEYGIDK